MCSSVLSEHVFNIFPHHSKVTRGNFGGAGKSIKNTNRHWPPLLEPRGLYSVTSLLVFSVGGGRGGRLRNASRGLLVFEVLSVDLGGMPRAICLFRKEPLRL